MLENCLKRLLPLDAVARWVRSPGRRSKSAAS